MIKQVETLKIELKEAYAKVNTVLLEATAQKEALVESLDKEKRVFVAENDLSVADHLA